MLPFIFETTIHLKSISWMNSISWDPISFFSIWIVNFPRHLLVHPCPTNLQCQFCIILKLTWMDQSVSDSILLHWSTCQLLRLHYTVLILLLYNESKHLKEQVPSPWFSSGVSWLFWVKLFFHLHFRNNLSCSKKKKPCSNSDGNCMEYID